MQRKKQGLGKGSRVSALPATLSAQTLSAALTSHSEALWESKKLEEMLIQKLPLHVQSQ